MTLDEWQAEGERRFGPDVLEWKFVCPSCGHVASIRDWKDAGAPVEAVAFSCVGRWRPGARRAADIFQEPGPCNYAGSGPFRLNPVAIEGREERYFAFAESEGAYHAHD